MRPLLKYGIPLAGGLAAAGGALAQGEDPGSAALAGVAGGAGAAGGLLAARGLAGKYAPGLSAAMRESVIPLGQKVSAEMQQAEPGSLKRKALEGVRERLAGGYKALDSGKTERYLGQALAGGLVPASAALAGLGGVAAGAIPGAIGVPGFQQAVVDPESYGSSNSAGARYKVPTTEYV
jgi:hypothetical protein